MLFFSSSLPTRQPGLLRVTRHTIKCLSLFKKNNNKKTGKIHPVATAFSTGIHKLRSE